MEDLILGRHRRLYVTRTKDPVVHKYYPHGNLREHHAEPGDFRESPPPPLMCLQRESLYFVIIVYARTYIKTLINIDE